MYRSDDADCYFVLFVLSCAAIAVAAFTIAWVASGPSLPTPTEACRPHGGVSSFNDGYAVCVDGVAREAA